jgi:hypothetical protein
MKNYHHPLQHKHHVHHRQVSYLLSVNSPFFIGPLACRPPGIAATQHPMLLPPKKTRPRPPSRVGTRAAGGGGVHSAGGGGEYPSGGEVQMQPLLRQPPHLSTTRRPSHCNLCRRNTFLATSPMASKQPRGGPIADNVIPITNIYTRTHSSCITVTVTRTPVARFRLSCDCW